MTHVHGISPVSVDEFGLFRNSGRGQRNGPENGPENDVIQALLRNMPPSIMTKPGWK
jgi:hypothetical protein